VSPPHETTPSGHASAGTPGGDDRGGESRAGESSSLAGATGPTEAPEPTGTTDPTGATSPTGTPEPTGTAEPTDLTDDPGSADPEAEAAETPTQTLPRVIRVPRTPHTIRYVARSDRGLVRSTNQDSVYAGDRILVIADGMGGHAAGDTASRLVVAAFAPLDSHPPQQDLLGALRAATIDGNAAIAETVTEHPELDGMGTTVTALYFDGNRLAMAHVGDSRAYLYRAGVLHQLTHDDTFVQSLVDDGRITEEEAVHHPQRNLLLRALNGTELEPSLTQREARAGDRYLICSDGLSGVVSAEAIADALTEADPERAADLLVELALVGGGPDNVTVVVADVLDTGSPATERLPTVVIDPDATGPISQMTREMPRVPLPPIPEEPGAPTRYASDDDELDDEDDELDEDLDEEDDLDGAAGDLDEGEDRPDPGVVRASAASGTGTADGPSPRGPDGPRRSPPDRRALGAGGRRWHRRGALVVALVALLLVAAGGSALWVRSQYFVGARGDVVGVYRGVNGSLLGVQFSSFQEDSCAGAAGCTPIRLSDLQPAARNQVLSGIQASSLTDARAVMSRLAGRLLPPCGSATAGNGGSSGGAAGGGSTPTGTPGDSGTTSGGGTADGSGTSGAGSGTTAPGGTAATTDVPTAAPTAGPTPVSTDGLAAGQGNVAQNGIQGTWPDMSRTKAHGTVVTVTVDGPDTRRPVITTTITPPPVTMTQQIVVTAAAPGLFNTVVARALAARTSTTSSARPGSAPATGSGHAPSVRTTTVVSAQSGSSGSSSKPSTGPARTSTSTVTASTPTVTLTETDVATTPVTGTPLAPAAEVPGVTCRVDG
jgi:protein phosphatase